MNFQADKFELKEESDFEAVRDEIVKRGEGSFDHTTISRAVSVWHDYILCGYFITCQFGGQRSFHGFKFVKGGLEFQLPMTRKYIDQEQLQYSAYLTKETRALLRVLGFKDIGSFEGVPVMRRELCHP